MKEHLFPILLLIVVMLIGGDELVMGLRNRRLEEKAFAAYVASEPVDTVWRGWNKYQIPRYSDSGKIIWYGHELIANTAYYLGPRGIVGQLSNGMNCQNCHLDGGTLPYGNNYGKVYTTYPQFRARSNGIQTIYGRINDCLERSLNGKALDTTSREIRAIYAYFQWLADDIPKGVARGGTGIMKLPFLDRAADPAKGHGVYLANCQTCHGAEGQGKQDEKGVGYTYPPLWGKNSYNDGAGLYRLSNFAGFVKNNMPFGTDYHHPKLTNAEAWDVAAFVNSQPRPHKDQSMDWKNIEKKPIDVPFGPFTDTFSEAQHKYGPWKPILASH